MKWRWNNIWSFTSAAVAEEIWYGFFFSPHLFPSCGNDIWWLHDAKGVKSGPWKAITFSLPFLLLYLLKFIYDCPKKFSLFFLSVNGKSFFSTLTFFFQFSMRTSLVIHDFFFLMILLFVWVVKCSMIGNISLTITECTFRFSHYGYMNLWKWKLMEKIYTKKRRGKILEEEVLPLRILKSIFQ